MKQLFPFFLILLSTSLFSQNFVQDNKQWNVIIGAYGMDGMSLTTEIFITSGDTIINNHNYSKVYRSGDSLENSYYNGAVREENNKIFYINTYGSEGLLYDFSLEEDDSTYIVTDFTYDDEQLLVIVDSVTYVEIGGIERKILWIHEDYMTGMAEYWIEGIGSNNGPLYTLIHNHIICPHWQLSCCYEEDEQIYQHDDLDCYANNVGLKEIDEPEIKIYPNPFKIGEPIYISAPSIWGKARIEFFDLTGNCVYRHNIETFGNTSIRLPSLKRGTYIVKIVNKNSKSWIHRLIVL